MNRIFEKIIIVTNKGGIGIVFRSVDDLDKIYQNMLQFLKKDNI